MSALYHYAVANPHSVLACEYDVSDRNYDCQNCEHFHVDCELGERIQEVLQNGQYDLLPPSLQIKMVDKLIKDGQKSLDELNSLKPPRPNLKGI